MRVCERGRATGKPVEIGRVDARMAVERRDVIVQIVEGDEEEIRLWGWGRPEPRAPAEDGQNDGGTPGAGEAGRDKRGHGEGRSVRRKAMRSRTSVGASAWSRPSGINETGSGWIERIRERGSDSMAPVASVSLT